MKIPTAQTLVITDDVALPFGSLRLRAKGSHAGHNGLKHIESALGSNQYPRLRFGIGNDYPKGFQVDYVLSRFTKEEFEAKIEQHEMVEWAKQYNNNLYGVTKEELKRINTKDGLGVWKIEYQGVINMKKKLLLYGRKSWVV